LRYTLVMAVLLLLVGCAQAQVRTSGTMPAFSGGGGGGGYSSSGPFTGGYGSGGLSGFSGSGSGGTPVMWEPPREFLLLYGRNDGLFVPSTFMKYEDALALGKRQIAQQELDAQTSFAETVRKAQAERVPTFRLRSRAVQDNSGKLQICNLNGNDCHQL
jgi:hypothetical protein